MVAVKVSQVQTAVEPLARAYFGLEEWEVFAVAQVVLAVVAWVSFVALMLVETLVWYLEVSVAEE
jgi:hypothetical protein